MKKWVAGLVMLCAGCASNSQLMVNQAGQTYTCGSYGQGIVGVAMASTIFDECLRSHKAAGYVEIEKAGVVGLSFAHETLRILKVSENSPAASAGILPGDVLTAVDGQPVSKTQEAKTLLFGPVGKPVTLALLRNNKEQTYTLARASFSEVFGIR